MRPILLHTIPERPLSPSWRRPSHDAPSGVHHAVRCRPPQQAVGSAVVVVGGVLVAYKRRIPIVTPLRRDQ